MPFTRFHIHDQLRMSDGETIKRQFYDLFNEPVSEQDQRRFCTYLGSDISEKKFTDKEFSQLFQIKPKLGQRLLRVFNQNQVCEIDSIPGSLVIRIVRVLWNYLTSVKAYILFKLFDENNDDLVSIDEIRLFYQENLSEFKIFKDNGQSTEVVNTFLKGFFPVNTDVQQQQELNFDQFYDILKRNPDVFKSLYLIGVPDQDKEEEKELIWYQRYSSYLKNNASRVSFIILYFLTLLSLIIYRVVSLKNQSIWRIIARSGGILVNFNFALAISLMLKQTMTIFRRIYYLRLIIPVDDHIDAHRLVGTVLFISAMIHSFGHMVHFAIYTDECTFIEAMFTTAAHVGWIGDAAPLTGDILFLSLVIMFFCSLQCVRQRPGFYKIFYYTHFLFWLMFILLVIHSEDFWKWTVGPMSLFILEKIYLLRRHSSNYGRTHLISVRIEDNDVVTLNIEKPKNFTFRTGEYINICIPSVSSNDWHPFTISSAPERKDILRVNIMKHKNWTKKVYEHFNEYLHYSSDTPDVTIGGPRHSSYRLDHSEVSSNEVRFAGEEDAIICIEGPFSSCTSYIFDCEHVVLIGAGIGITPYICALDSLIHRFREERSYCNHCDTATYNHARIASRKLKKVDFIWVNRDFKNIAWFQHILAEFENEQDSYLNAIPVNTTDPQEQRARYLDIHLYCTSLRSNEQTMLGNLPYDLVSNMYAATTQQDMHTRLKTRTRIGRPPWKLLLSKFKSEHQSTDVFFTGNLMMGNEIKRYCDELGFPFRRESGF